MQVAIETCNMDALNIIEAGRPLDWRYDQDADVLYISVGSPRPALGLDIGDGVVVRYDEARREVTGITIVGLRDKMTRELSSTISNLND